MLVLTRDVGQRIYLGDDVTITVCKIRRDGRMRIGIEAPKEMAIVRDDAGRKTKQEGTA